MEEQRQLEGPGEPGEPGPEVGQIKRHRWTALWNGVVIGMGAFMLIGGFVLGIVPLIMGIGLEVLHRKRLDKQQAPPV